MLDAEFGRGRGKRRKRIRRGRRIAGDWGFAKNGCDYKRLMVSELGSYREIRHGVRELGMGSADCEVRNWGSEGRCGSLRTILGCWKFPGSSASARAGGSLLIDADAGG